MWSEEPPPSPTQWVVVGEAWGHKKQRWFDNPGAGPGAAGPAERLVCAIRKAELPELVMMDREVSRLKAGARERGYVVAEYQIRLARKLIERSRAVRSPSDLQSVLDISKKVLRDGLRDQVVDACQRRGDTLRKVGTVRLVSEVPVSVG